jgi:hypothetical protein
MKRLALVSVLAAASPALADGPAPSNGWNWMAQGVTSTPVCLGGGVFRGGPEGASADQLVYLRKMRCLWRGADNALWTAPYENGAFPAPTNWEGQLTSAPGAGSSVYDAGRSAAEWKFMVGVRGTDNGIWTREVIGDQPGAWTPLTGTAKSRPICAVAKTGRALCAVQGSDDGFWINPRDAAGKWGGWNRVDDFGPTPRLDVKSGVQIFAESYVGDRWTFAYLGKVTSEGKRELVVGSQWSAASTKGLRWKSQGDVRAAPDTDLNCQVDQVRPWASAPVLCTAVTLEGDVNVISVDLTGTAKPFEKILPKPTNYKIYGATIAQFTTSQANRAGLFAVGIRTHHNHFWLQALK